MLKEISMKSLDKYMYLFIYVYKYILYIYIYIYIYKPLQRKKSANCHSGRWYGKSYVMPSISDAITVWTDTEKTKLRKHYLTLFL